jgi:hypothetical protein
MTDTTEDTDDDSLTDAVERLQEWIEESRDELENMPEIDDLEVHTVDSDDADDESVPLPDYLADR